MMILIKNNCVYARFQKNGQKGHFRPKNNIYCDRQNTDTTPCFREALLTSKKPTLGRVNTGTKKYKTKNKINNIKMLGMFILFLRNRYYRGVNHYKKGVRFFEARIASLKQVSVVCLFCVSHYILFFVDENKPTRLQNIFSCLSRFLIWKNLTLLEKLLLTTYYYY